MANEIYLFGGIELAGKTGKSWRDKSKKRFAEVGLTAFHPYETESHILTKYGFKNNKQLLNAKYRDLDTYRKCMKEIIYYDITHVAQSKVLFGRLDASVREGTGTCGELTIAKDMLLPIVGVIDYKDLRKIAGWAIACCDYLYDNFPEAEAKVIELLEKQ